MDDVAGREHGYGSDRWTLNDYLDTKTDLCLINGWYAGFILEGW